ncbi:MAG: hypothetical protein Q7T03_03590 [Deltaproteobacteria bacterium]|nr:hypothetical protein [Deltaproteobacteria bacterium]
MKQMFFYLIFLFVLSVATIPAHAGQDPFIDSPEVREKIEANREEVAKKLHLGGDNMWELMGLMLSIAILIEIVNSVRREPNLSEVLGGFFAAALMGLLIYKIFGLIEGFMNGMAQSIAGSTSYWESLAESAKSLKADGSFWEKAGEAMKILYFNLSNPLVIVLQVFNYFSYLFVLIIVKIIKVVQGTLLTYLHAVAPLVVALSIIPRFNLLPTYILTIISISSWSLFGAIIGRQMAITGGSGLILTSLPDLIHNTMANVTGGFAVLAVPALAVTVFNMGGSLGSVLGGVIGSGIGVMRSTASLLTGSLMGSSIGYFGQSGGTAASAASGAASGAMLGPSGIVQTIVNPSQTLRSFVTPKKPEDKNSHDPRHPPHRTMKPFKRQRRA